MLGEYHPRSFLYRPRFTHSITERPQAIFVQYGPCPQLIRSLYHVVLCIYKVQLCFFVEFQATIDDLQTKVSQILKPNHSSVVSRGHLGEKKEDISYHLLNLTVDVTKLSEDMRKHSRKLAELVC